jgi:hypothetical protein
MARAPVVDTFAHEGPEKEFLPDWAIVIADTGAFCFKVPQAILP